MKRFFTLYLLLTASFFAHANSAMPGIWQAGANGIFIPLFPQDSVHFGKIKMQREQIQVNLYPGFAVVKGEYWMYNTTAQEIDMHVAYPKQGTYDAAIVQNVVPTYISAIQVKVNDQPVTLMQPTDSSLEKLPGTIAITENNFSNRWFIWQMKFAPRSITKITVYFITDNSNSDVVKGYSHRKGDAFTYVLESGRAWGGVIDTGDIYIQLKGGLTENDITGILPDSTLSFDNNKLLYHFINKEPLPKDNLLIFYKDSPEDFDFKSSVLPKTSKYFTEIDAFDVPSFKKENMQLVHKVDMLPDNGGMGPFGGILIAMGIAALLVVGLMIWLIVSAIKSAIKRRNADNS